MSVGQRNHQVGRSCFVIGDFNAFFLYLLVGFAQTGGIGKNHRIAVEIHINVDCVAGSAGNVGHNDRLAPGKRVEQAGLTGVRFARDHYPETFAQTLASIVLSEVGGNLPVHFKYGVLQLVHQIGRQFLIGKINISFQIGKNFHQLFPPAVIKVFQPAFHLPQRIFLLFAGFRVNQIRQAFSFGQIHFAVIKRAFGKFARFGQPKTIQPAEVFQHGGNHRPGSVGVNFHRVFAGEGSGSLEIKHQRMIQHFARQIVQRGKISMTRHHGTGIKRGQTADDGKRIGTGNAENGNAGLSGRGG